ncbi:MAG: cysteine desulfurase [Clostridia bacterium]|nr:cysteine desulfurase [Clostridia bacterium]
MNNVIYLDNAATTKPLNSAVKRAEQYLFADFYNPSAKYHGGITAKNAIKNARSLIEKQFGINYEVIFTSCGSESDNTAIFSYLKRGNAVTTLGEHSAVYEPFTHFKNNGYDARFASLNEDGSVNVENLLSLVDNNTVFVSVVHVNNETGAINDINDIAKRVKAKNPRVIFHSDGVQAFLKVPFKPNGLIDLYSISAHKVGGFKGVGALIKHKNVKNLKPLILGGGQENALRSGTENVYGIKTFEYAVEERQCVLKNYENALELKNAFLNNINLSIFKVISSNNSSPYVISISALGLRGEVLQHMLEENGVIVGTGSACSSKHPHSRILTAIGYDKKVLDGVLRISFSPETTMQEVLTAVQLINEKALQLKKAIL